MNIGNRNTDRENFFIRKRLRIVVLIVFFIGIVLTVFRYFEFVSKTVYEESVSHFCLLYTSIITHLLSFYKIIS